MSTGVQEGIYFDKGAQPGRFFNLAFLRASPECTAATVRAIVGQLWAALQGLKRGEVIALPGRPVPVADHRLSVLVGYGVKAFSLAGVVRAAPAGLGPEFHFRSALPAGGGALLRGSGLSYAADIKQNPGTEEIVLQFIADSQLAVHRCVVETWKILHAHTDAGTGSAPLNLAAVFSGFQRDDGRSWIDFHDGVSNLISGDERRGVLAVKAENAPEPADAWTGDGSYLAFLRLAVDLAAWQRLSRTEQELLVGRDKLTGCPLVGRDRRGWPVPAPGCPVTGTDQVIQRGNERFREPRRPDDPVLRRSHVQRSNQHVTPPEQPNSLRIYRQGYEFLEASPEAGGFRAGLNFVSFQDTPERLLRILVQDGWLGRTNFGGDPAAPAPGLAALLSVRAAGIYLAPPATDGEVFPGAAIFG